MLSACSNLFFFPAPNHILTPTAYGLEYRDIELVADDGNSLHAWFLPALGQVKGTVLFLHGNAENISTHTYNVRWLPEAGYQVLALDYRGFGHSEGSSKLPDIFLDIDAAMAWLSSAADTKDQPLFILGQSIGASLMLHGAIKHTDQPILCALISDAAFTRYRNIADHVSRQSWLTWAFHWPIFWRGLDQYDPIDGVAELAQIPVLFFHSSDDQVIPFANLDLLIAAHKGSHQRIATTGPHTATFMQNANRRALLEFNAAQDCTNSNSNSR